MLFFTTGFSVEGLISIQAPAPHATLQSFAVNGVSQTKGQVRLKGFHWVTLQLGHCFWVRKWAREALGSIAHQRQRAASGSSRDV